MLNCSFPQWAWRVICDWFGKVCSKYFAAIFRRPLGRRRPIGICLYCLHHNPALVHSVWFVSVMSCRAHVRSGTTSIGLALGTCSLDMLLVQSFQAPSGVSFTLSLYIAACRMSVCITHNLKPADISTFLIVALTLLIGRQELRASGL